MARILTDGTTDTSTSKSRIPVRLVGQVQKYREPYTGKNRDEKSPGKGVKSNPQIFSENFQNQFSKKKTDRRFQNRPLKYSRQTRIDQIRHDRPRAMPDSDGSNTPKDDKGPQFLLARSLIEQVHTRPDAHASLNAYPAHSLKHDEDDAQSPVSRAHCITLHYSESLTRYSGIDQSL